MGRACSVHGEKRYAYSFGGNAKWKDITRKTKT
jgi:hypothetical protein